MPRKMITFGVTESERERLEQERGELTITELCRKRVLETPELEVSVQNYVRGLAHAMSIPIHRVIEAIIIDRFAKEAASHDVNGTSGFDSDTFVFTDKGLITGLDLSTRLQEKHIKQLKELNTRGRMDV